MSKLLVTFPLFWIVLSLSAQNTNFSFQESESPFPPPRTSSGLSFSQLIQEEQRMEKAIILKVSSYQEAKKPEQIRLLSDIKKLLFEVLDLKIQQKEMEITLLDRELSAMQRDSMYAHKKEQFESLKESIRQVEENLQFRKAHRNAIVLNRLKELGIGE